ncbi:MAG: hypothetical protein K6F39_04875 [Lachnospiraceae bacterium]|nr:hypothetical protein [Lachnospiraceae bacterium]
MSSFTVTSNYYLKSLYKNNQVYATALNRENVNNGLLMAADTKALMNGTAVMNSINYGDAEDDEALETKRFYLNLKAFADTYNYTMESASKSSTAVSKSVVKKIKKLYAKYESKLESLGIEFDTDGYMELDKSSIDDIDKSKYEKLFGKDSEFMSELKSLAKKLSKHIDYTV